MDLSKHVSIISSEIRRLDEVVNGFLKFARPDELKLQPVQLATLVSDVVTTAMPEADARGVVIKSECASTLPEINADPGMLGQALLNLAINSCQAMPNGGTLRINCRADDRRRVVVDVEDTGVGIPPEHLSRIFDLYFTTKKEGQRNRALNGLPDRPAPRWRGRSAVDPRARNPIPSDVSSGLIGPTTIRM